MSGQQGRKFGKGAKGAKNPEKKRGETETHGARNIQRTTAE